MITGAASGIGKATAVLFAARGWFVGLYDINDALLKEVSGSIGEQGCCAKRLDVTNVDSVKSAIRHFTSHTGGKLDVLFNCAGILQIGPYDSLTLEKHHQTIDVNFKGIVNCAYEALPSLISTEDARMISMASASSLSGTPDLASYSATKFAVRGLTEALNIEWEQYDIHVCDIMPLYVDTPMVRENPSPKSMRRLGVRLTPEKVAAVVWKAANRKKIHWTVGIQIKFLYEISGLLSENASKFIMKIVSGY